MSNTTLTPKREKFANLYVETGNKSEAYRGSYSCSNMSEKQIWEEASKLSKNPKVAQRIKELQTNLEKRSDITKDKIINELAKIAFSSIAYLHNTWIERVDFEKLTSDQKASIKNISTKVEKKNTGTNKDPDIIQVEYVKIELHDKIKALESISKMLGYDIPIKQEESKISLNIQVVDPSVKDEIEKL
ncbi:terminase small subunit [Dysgonomonas sp.]|uniref:terminase small subunit n=1 Tax=Dysgonomonas sp. TaxID=1891233 RepID=UPI0027BA05CE|nr:terminase small subunit [Dysgonomonas sp.]